MYNQVQSAQGSQLPQQGAQGASPQNPAQNASPTAPTQQKAPKQGASSFIPIAIGVIILIAIAGSVYVFTNGSFLKGSSTTIAATSTISGGNVGQLSSCTTISQSGKYYFSSNVKATETNGACIDVAASNVSIVCNNNGLTGSGPFEDIPPFSYAIEINGQNNVTVSGCNIKNFSYAVFAVASNNLNVANNNFSINFMSNIYLANVHNSIVKNNYLSKSSSPQGSLYLTNSTSGVNIFNNTIEYNLYYGISVNSSNNILENNLVNGTQYSFSCSVPNGFVISSKASSNICYNNTGCGFLECTGTNIPDNVSQITLGTVITTCGTISAPGSYLLGSDLSMSQFVNVSNPLSSTIPCINIDSKNVQLNCNGFTISNSTTAIIADNKNNLTISNCKIINSRVAGINLFNTSQSHLSNISLINDSYGIELYNSTINSFNGVRASNNTYGIYVSGSYSNSFQYLNFSANNYGVFMQSSSLSNNFNHDFIENSTKLDVYTTADSSNATYNLMQSSVCGSTNAVWATCTEFVSTNLPYVPISSCRSINSPGNYLLTTSLINSAQNCIKIQSKNVVLGCESHIITSTSDFGSGITVTSSKNVSINNCGVQGFLTSVNVSNSALVSISQIKTKRSFYGITFSNVSSSNIANSSINGTTNVSIFLSHSSGNKVYNNIVTYGQDHNVAFLISNSINNQVLNNTATTSYVGMDIVGASQNNFIQNNTMGSDSLTDYACLGNNGLGSESGGINYGTTKIDCFWLAALVKGNAAAPCKLSTTPDLITFTQDARYSAGTTCFVVEAPQTTINCQGHTIISTNGGVFATFDGVADPKLENCQLKGFSQVAVVNGSDITILNNTVLTNSTLPQIILSNVRLDGPTIDLNNITAGSNAIVLENIALGTMQNNIVHKATTAYLLYNASTMVLSNNTAGIGTTNGMIMGKGTTLNQFQDNIFNSTGTGLQCLSSSSGSANNTDEGGNHCSSNSGCAWIKSSVATC